MKKLFVFFAAIGCALALNATTYTCHIKVTINGESTEQEQVQVDVNENNGTYDLSLKNFVLSVQGVNMPVGNINVNGVEGIDEYGYTTITFKSSINITEGDDSQDLWVGPMLGEVPVDLTSRFTNTALSANIDIDMMAMISQIINVEIFGVAPDEGGLEGDVNKDHEVNIADVNAVIDIVLSK